MYTTVDYSQFLLEYLLTDIPNYGLLSPVLMRRRPLRRWIPISCYQYEYSFVIISVTTKRLTKHLPVLAVSIQVLHFRRHSLLSYAVSVVVNNSFCIRVLSGSPIWYWLAARYLSSYHSPFKYLRLSRFYRCCTRIVCFAFFAWAMNMLLEIASRCWSRKAINLLARSICSSVDIFIPKLAAVNNI